MANKPETPAEWLRFWADAKCMRVPGPSSKPIDLSFDFLVYGEAELWLDGYVMRGTAQFGIIFQAPIEKQLLELIEKQPHPILIVDPCDVETMCWVNGNGATLPTGG